MCKGNVFFYEKQLSTNTREDLRGRPERTLQPALHAIAIVSDVRLV